MAVSARLRQQIAARAGGRCEYCGLSHEGQAATFHVDHILPQAAGGLTVLDNLALACVFCSLRKGARQHAVDPKTGTRVRLYHPRHDHWNTHFRWSGCKLVGISPMGRATVSALDLNSTEHVIVRGFERQLGRHPPPRHV